MAPVGAPPGAQESGVSGPTEALPPEGDQAAMAEVDAPAPGMAVRRLVAASGWGSRIVAMAAQFISIRLLVSGLGPERYSAYALLSSMVGWYVLADLGIGYSLQNYVAEKRAVNGEYRDYLGTTVVILAVVSLAGIAAVALIAPIVAPWYLHKYASVPAPEAVAGFMTAGVLFTIITLAGVGTRIWYAVQRGYVPNLLNAAAAVLSVACIWVATHGRGPIHLTWCLLAVLAPSAIISVGALAWALRSEKVRIHWNTVTARTVARRASPFCANAALAVVILEMDYLVMSQTVSPHGVLMYSLVDRIFGSASIMFAIALQALAPHATELSVTRNWRPLVDQMRYHLLAGFAFMAGITALVVLADRRIVAILAPNVRGVIPLSLLLLYGAYQLLTVWVSTFAIVLQSQNDMRPFLVVGACQAVLTGPLIYYLAARFDIFGVVLGLLLTALLTSAWAFPLRFTRRLRAAGGVA